jgi:UPF0755 protein
VTLRRLSPFAAAVLAIFLIVALSAFWMYMEIETPYYRASSEDSYIEIPRGMDSGSAAQLLVDSGVLRHRIPFIVYLKLTGNAGRIKAGEYRFREAASPSQIAERLIRGDSYYRSITIPEGLTAMETVALLAENNFGQRKDLEEALQNTEWISDLDPGARNLEGYLFPETYHFNRKIDSTAIIKTMVEQFQKEFRRIMSQTPMRAGWNPSRIVTLASMIEKEVQKGEERPLVASVFYNRLERRMKLDCDATIIYAMKLHGTYEGNIRRSDLAMESPYNTYRNQGLPPGPIANPGAASLNAAVHPAETEYLFYVSRNDGTHIFSKTYQEHQRAVDEYQRRRR